MERLLPRFSVSQFIELTNQTLEYAYPLVEVEGEIANFKVNQNKYVFFDLKDESGTLNCFMSIYQLRMPLEDGQAVRVQATPKLTNWGRFSLTIKLVQPVGEGSIRKSFELLKQKLTKEGLFNEERKRPLPAIPSRVAVISSQQAAGYADFIKIVNQRFGGLTIDVAQVQVQGAGAADQIIRALKHFNGRELLPEVIVIIRGGGSADDLSTFNDEPLVREIAASRVPVLTGIGHETDESLADLAADVSAATPSNAAQILVPDREALRAGVRYEINRAVGGMDRGISGAIDDTHHMLSSSLERMLSRVDSEIQLVEMTKRLLSQFDPRQILKRGYSIVHGAVVVGKLITIEQYDKEITAEVKDVKKR